MIRNNRSPKASNVIRQYTLAEIRRIRLYAAKVFANNTHRYGFPSRFDFDFDDFVQEFFVLFILKERAGCPRDQLLKSTGKLAIYAFRGKHGQRRTRGQPCEYPCSPTDLEALSDEKAGLIKAKFLTQEKIESLKE